RYTSRKWHPPLPSTSRPSVCGWSSGQGTTGPPSTLARDSSSVFTQPVSISQHPGLQVVSPSGWRLISPSSTWFRRSRSVALCSRDRSSTRACSNWPSSPTLTATCSISPRATDSVAWQAVWEWHGSIWLAVVVAIAQLAGLTLSPIMKAAIAGTEARGTPWIAPRTGQLGDPDRHFGTDLRDPQTARRAQLARPYGRKPA